MSMQPFSGLGAPSPATPSAATVTYDDDVRLAHVVADAAQASASYSPSRGKTADAPAAEDCLPAVEQAIRQVLRRARPRDHVLVADASGGNPAHLDSEAPGLLPGSTGARCWLVQPVITPEHLHRGVPLWGTSLTLLDGPDVVAALASFPALNRRWWAARGSGAWTGRTLSSASACQVGTTSRLDQARVSCDDLAVWHRARRMPTLLALSTHSASTLALGPIWPFLLLAEGGVDVVAQPSTSLLDVAGACLIAHEAGAVVSDLAGNPGPAGANVVACVPALHEQILALILTR